MKEQFVTYEIALKLKELGFDKSCLGIIYSDSQVITGSNEFINIMLLKDSECIKTPLWQQTIDWFRTKYNWNIFIQQIWYNNYKSIAYFPLIYSNPETEITNSNNRFEIVLLASEQDVPGNHINDELYDKNIFETKFAFKTYEEAREQVILKAIELCKNN